MSNSSISPIKLTAFITFCVVSNMMTCSLMVPPIQDPNAESMALMQNKGMKIIGCIVLFLLWYGYFFRFLFKSQDGKDRWKYELAFPVILSLLSWQYLIMIQFEGLNGLETILFKQATLPTLALFCVMVFSPPFKTYQWRVGIICFLFSLGLTLRFLYLYPESSLQELAYGNYAMQISLGMILCLIGSFIREKICDRRKRKSLPVVDKEGRE